MAIVRTLAARAGRRQLAVVSIVASLVAAAGSLAVVHVATAQTPATNVAATVPCGKIDPKTKQVARATLTLDETNSVLTKAFARRIGSAEMLAEFRTAGCVLPARLARVHHAFLPRLATQDLPPGSVTVERVHTDGSRVQVLLRADPAHFDPGTYGGYLELSAPALITARVPIEISRSENSAVWPVVIGVVGGLAGLVWFVLLNFAKGATTVIRPWHYVLVFLAAAIAGALTVIAGWLDQDVWTVEENGLAAAISAFTGATTGTMATAIAILWGDPEPKPGESARGDPEHEPGEAPGHR